MDIDFGLAWEKAEDLLNDLIRQLPNIGLGLIAFLFFYFASRWVGQGVERLLNRSRRSRHAGKVFGRLACYGTVITGALVALMVILPDFQPGALIGTLGVGSVAIGFAFREILQNFLAGLLILFTEPFHIGDQIVVEEFEGTIEDIQIRATRMRTYDGRAVVIPNATLFTNSVIVNTNSLKRRTEYDIRIGYHEDTEQARALILDAINSVPETCEEPAPDALLMELTEDAAVFRARWWTSSMRNDVVRVQDRVLTAIKQALTSHGMGFPFPSRTVYFHNRTPQGNGQYQEGEQDARVESGSKRIAPRGQG